MSYTHEGNMNWIQWTLRLQLLFAIFSHSEMMGQMMEELSMEIHTSGRIPCIHNISPELIDLVRWVKSSRGDHYASGNEFLVAWRGDRIIRDQDYSIDTNFSLVIHNVTAMYMGIYRCTVVPKDATEVSNSDSRLTVYKNPEPPSITYEILGDDKIKINCTHGPVFPLLYPSFPFPFQNNRTILKDEGTYMVSISAVQQFSESEITLYCSNSYPGQHQSSFLNVYRCHEGEVYATTHPPESKTTPKHSSTPTELGGQHVPRDSISAIFVMTVLIMLMTVLFMTRLIRRIVVRRRKDNSNNKLVQAAEKTDIDDAHALFKLMLMQILMMTELEEVKSRLQATDRQLSRRSGKGSRFATDTDQGTKDEKRKVVHSLRESAERIPLMDMFPDEDENRIGSMQIVNRLRNIREEQEENGILEELAATLRALQKMEANESITPPNTEGANNGGTLHVFNDKDILQMKRSKPDVMVM